MPLRHQPLDKPDIFLQVDDGPVGPVQDIVPLADGGEPGGQQAGVPALDLEVGLQIHPSLQQSGQVGGHVGIFLHHRGGALQEGVAEVAHDKAGAGVVRRHLVQGEGVAVLQMGPREGGQPHVDRHRLVVPGGQLVDGPVDGVGQPDPVIAGIELYPAAALPLQILLHPLRQVGNDPLPALHQGAVQADAVVEQVRRVVVIGGVQAPVAHDHPVDHVQLAVDLPQMLSAVLVPYRLGHGVSAGGGLEQVEMGVDNFHKAPPCRTAWVRTVPASYCNTNFPPVKPVFERGVPSSWSGEGQSADGAVRVPLIRQDRDLFGHVLIHIFCALRISKKKVKKFILIYLDK